jgi:hypothetical protein
LQIATLATDSAIPGWWKSRLSLLDRHKNMAGINWSMGPNHPSFSKWHHYMSLKMIPARDRAVGRQCRNLQFFFLTGDWNWLLAIVLVPRFSCVNL